MLCPFFENLTFINCCKVFCSKGFLPKFLVHCAFIELFFHFSEIHAMVIAGIGTVLLPFGWCVLELSLGPSLIHICNKFSYFVRFLNMHTLSILIDLRIFR